MSTLTANPSKAEEIAHFNEFVNALPRGSYLHAMLADAVAVVASNISNDFATDPLGEVWERQREELTALAKMKAERAELAESNRVATLAARSLTREMDRIRKAIDDMRAEARSIAYGKTSH